MALSIGGEYEANRITGDNWRLCAAHLRLDEELVMTTVKDMATRLPEAAHAARQRLPGGLADMFADRFLELLARRADRCLTLLRSGKR